MSDTVKKFEDLNVWKEGTRLAVEIYKRLSNCRDYSFRDQIQRAVVSIPSNIAEGQGRDTTADFLRFLSIANGSRRELETQTIIAQRLDYISEQQSEQILDLATEVGRLRHGLADSLKRKQ